MSRDYLIYWRLDTVEDALRDRGEFDYAASEQYSRVAAGDTVWAVFNRGGRLHLAGRLVVKEVTDRDGAARAVGSAALWRADHYLLPVPGTVRPIADIDIHHLALDLRFAGKNDRLIPKEAGSIDARQLQTMRELAGDSPRLLADALGVG